jgi:hypothetical protein
MAEKEWHQQPHIRHRFGKVIKAGKGVKKYAIVMKSQSPTEEPAVFVQPEQENPILSSEEERKERELGGDFYSHYDQFKVKANPNNLFDPKITIMDKDGNAKRTEKAKWALFNPANGKILFAPRNSSHGALYFEHMRQLQKKYPDTWKKELGNDSDYEHISIHHDDKSILLYAYNGTYNNLDLNKYIQLRGGSTDGYSRSSRKEALIQMARMLAPYTPYKSNIEGIPEGYEPPPAPRGSLKNSRLFGKQTIKNFPTDMRYFLDRSQEPVKPILLQPEQMDPDKETMEETAGLSLYISHKVILEKPDDISSAMLVSADGKEKTKATGIAFNPVNGKLLFCSRVAHERALHAYASQLKRKYPDTWKEKFGEHQDYIHISFDDYGGSKNAVIGTYNGIYNGFSMNEYYQKRGEKAMRESNPAVEAATAVAKMLAPYAPKYNWYSDNDQRNLIVEAGEITKRSSLTHRLFGRRTIKQFPTDMRYYLDRSEEPKEKNIYRYRAKELRYLRNTRLGRGRHITGEEAREAFEFYSPNEEEGTMDFDKALEISNGPNEEAFIKQIEYLDQELNKKVTTTNAVGSWFGEDKKVPLCEPSTISYNIEGIENFEELCAHAAIKGLLGNQKWVISFLEGKGEDFVYTVGIRGNMNEVHTIFTDAGLAHTLTRNPHRRDVTDTTYFDEKGKTQMEYNALMEKLNANHKLLTDPAVAKGTGKWLGDDDRAKAQKVFKKAIDDYTEAKPE